MKKYLLVEPNFPSPKKSKNHKDFLPIGLLKIATYLRGKGNKVKLVRGEEKKKIDEDHKHFYPDEIWVTSLFTYWAGFVRDSVKYYKDKYPKAKVVVGGIYASLFSKDEVKEYTGCDEVIQGVLPEAEECQPSYDLLNGKNSKKVDYQILHGSRGCKRHCEFCGTWKIEPKFEPKKSIKNEIFKRKIVFYDNNFLMNPYVENILDELIELKKSRKILWCESQSGFDGRLLAENPQLAFKLKKAGFRYLRIAWDWGYDQHKKIKFQIDVLKEGGYRPKDIFVFVLYNWDIPYKEMEKKRMKCWEWGVQMSDCRFRPLHQLYDNYNPRKKHQSSEDYYIHEKAGWNDHLIKKFRRNIRRQNICIRLCLDIYSSEIERKKISKEIINKVREQESIEKKLEF